MLKDTDIIHVRNRNIGSTGYVIPERNLRRSWAVGETKKIPFEELKAFSYQPGGMYALKNLFVVENSEALDLLLNEKVEPEYFYSDKEIKDLLLNGSIDAFADFLDFAPEGAIEIAKDIAIKEKIPDVRKRDMISKKTGLNINNAIMVNEVMDEEDKETKDAEAPSRRVPIENKEEEKEEPTRRVAAPKYNVVKTEK